MRLQLRPVRASIDTSRRSSSKLARSLLAMAAGAVISNLGCGGDEPGGGTRGTGGAVGQAGDSGSGGASGSGGGQAGTGGNPGGSGGQAGNGGAAGTAGGRGGSAGMDAGQGGKAGSSGTAGGSGQAGSGVGGAAGVDGGKAGSSGSAGLDAGQGGSGPSDAGSPTSGCGKPWMGTDITQEMRSGRAPMQIARRTIVINNVTREYLVAVPKTYDAAIAYPLVIGLHGSGGTREQLRGYMDVETPANQGAIFIYPTGLPQDDGGVNEWNLSNNSDDLTFIDALIAQYSGELCIDQKKLFATGHSFGGCMSNALGCFRGKPFRAIAPVAGCAGRATGCTGRIATLQIHSPKDTSVGHSGAINACTRYLRANTCDEMPACGCYRVDGVTDPAQQCVQTAVEPYQTSINLAATAQDEQPPVARSYINCDVPYPVVFVDHWRREKSTVGDPAERWHNPPPWSGALVWEFFSKLPVADIE